MKKSWTSTLILLLFCLAGQAALAQEISKEKEANIRRLLELSGSNRIAVQVMHQQLEYFKANYPQIPEKFWQEIERESGTIDFVSIIVPVYAKYLSDQEVKDVITFYESAAGKKFFLVLPSMLQEAMPLFQAKGDEISHRVLDRMKAEGYFGVPPSPAPAKKPAAKGKRRSRAY
jgi:hypothetical protein